MLLLAESRSGSTPPTPPLLDRTSAVLDTGAETLESLAVYLGMLGVDFEVSEPGDLVAQLRVLADRYRRATPSAGSR